MNKSILKEKPRFNYSSYSWGEIASVKKRFQGKSKKEISEIMKNVRKGVNKDV
jgi:hypothetical protein